MASNCKIICDKFFSSVFVCSFIYSLSFPGKAHQILPKDVGTSISFTLPYKARPILNGVGVFSSYFHNISSIKSDIRTCLHQQQNRIKSLKKFPYWLSNKKLVI